MGSQLSPAIASALRGYGTGTTSVSGASATGSSGPPSRAKAWAAIGGAILAGLPSAAGTTTTTANGGPTAPATDPTAVAQAVAAALGQSGASGLPTVLTSIQSAVDGAIKSLTQQGLSATAADNIASDYLTQLSGQVDAIAASLTAPTAGGTAAPGGAAAAGPTTGTGLAAGGSVSLSESGSVRLLLQDGSAVTIRLRSREGLAVAGASASAATGAAAYAAANAFSAGSFSVQVQGSLTSADQQAISDVLGQVDTLAGQFFSGNVAQAFATAGALSIDPNEIARVSIRLSESASIAYGAVGAAPSAPVAASDPGAASAESTPAVASGAAPTAGAGALATTSALAAPATSAAAPVTADAGSSGAGSAGASSSLDTIFAYLKAVVAALGASGESGSVTFSARAKLSLLVGAVGAQSTTPTESSGAGFLKQVAASA